MHLYTTDPSARDREIGSAEELRAQLNFKTHKVLRVYCVISLPEDREVYVRSRTAWITANTGDKGGREGGREGGWRAGGMEGGREGGREGGTEEEELWREVLGNNYHMFMLYCILPFSLVHEAARVY